LQIEIENINNRSFITSFGKDFISIDNQKYSSDVIIYNSQVNTIKETLPVFSRSNLSVIENILNNNKDIDIILFGTGKTLKEIPVFFQKLLIKKNKKYEVMISTAAYRTYNILLSEGRSVVSVLKVLI
tara:strand:+ start:106 stop:489 length:384 start_codon:yes stop_codon:yes gene_type:complete